MSFPKGFLWGTSISAEQVEGGWNEGGKSPVQLDFAVAAENHKMPRKLYYRDQNGERASQFTIPIYCGGLPEGGRYELFDDLHYTNHDATDFYHHYKEDIALLAEMGHTTFNTSISWARILPYGIQGGVNQEGVEFYRSVFQECRKYGIDPVITLYKYDEPVYFEETYGDWTNRAMIDEFVAFARICFQEYQGLVNKWLTFNEINILMVMSEASGKSQQKNYEMLHNQMVAAARAVQAAHAVDPSNRVGCMICGVCTYPFTPDPQDVLGNYYKFQKAFCYSADTMVFGGYPSYAEWLRRKDGVDLVISDADKEDLRKGKADFLAFSYYTSSTYTTHLDEGEEGGGNIFGGSKPNPYISYSEWGWSKDPIGFKYFLHLLNDRYRVPLFDVENGLGATDVLEADGSVHDPYRIDYLRSHIRCMKEAVEEGVNLFGYTTWGGLDLVAASTGEVSKRYGFIYVDIDDAGKGTFKRYKKDSFYWYKQVCESNGEVL